MSDVPEVVTFGETMALLLAEPGVPLAHATDFRRHMAGAESNVAIGLRRLGHPVRWIGRIGEDPFGDAILRALRGEDIDVSHVTRDDEAPTGLLVRDCHAERPIEVVYHRRNSAGSRLDVDDVSADALSGARLLHVTGITPLLSETARAATAAAIEHARGSGMTVSFDPNIRRRLCPPQRAAEVLRPLAAKADLILAAVDEAELLSDATGREMIARWFIDHGAALVVLKDGPRGSWATDGNDEWEQAAAPVVVTDPVGAGDAFAAGFLSAWLRGEPVPVALSVGATVAAAVVQTVGDTDGLPTDSQTTTLMGPQEVRR